MADAVDIVLQQTQMVAMACGPEGMAVAAGLSVVDAIYDAFKPSTPKPRFNMRLALAQLADKVADDIKASEQNTREAQIKAIATKTHGLLVDAESMPHDHPDITRDKLNDRVANLQDDDLIALVFGWFGGDDSPESATNQQRAQDLPQYLEARTNLHALYMAMLQYKAKWQGFDKDQAWMGADRELRNEMVDSLKRSIAYIKPMVDKMADTYANANARADEKAALETDPRAKNTAWTKEWRTEMADAHLDQSWSPTEADVKNFQETIRLWGTTHDSLAKATDNPVVTPSTGGNTPTGATLGVRAADTLRVLFEHDAATNSWLNPVADPMQSAGLTAVQNAGSTDAGIYYQVGGGTLNGTFATELTAAGLLSTANAALQKDYDAKYGAGSWTNDSTTPPQPARLTSFLVPITPGAGAIGSMVCAMVYSVGPKLDSTGLTDTTGYQQIYADAFDAIAAWNLKHPNIVNLRVALVSTMAYAGNNDPSAISATAAGLVLDAATAAMKAHPLQLSTLTLLVNSNPSKGDIERHAFTTAAGTRGVTSVLDEGFDLPLA